MKPLSSLLHSLHLLCSRHLIPVTGDSGHYWTAQAKQRDVQSVQQLLLPGGWPCPWITGQSDSDSISQFVDQSIFSGALCSESWRGGGTPNEFIVASFPLRPNGSPSTAVVVCLTQTPNTHVKRLHSSHPWQSHTQRLLTSSTRTLSWPNRESSSPSVYNTLMDLLWPTLGLAGRGWTLAKCNLIQENDNEILSDT